jgi:hypothetical protein
MTMIDETTSAPGQGNTAPDQQGQSILGGEQQTPPGGEKQPDAQSAASWLDGLPDDLKGLEALQSIPDVAGLAKAFLETQGKLPKVPEGPDKYEIKLPDGVVEDDGIKALRDFAHKSGLTNEQVNGVLDLHGQITKTAIEKAMVEGEATLKTELGEKFAETVDIANRAVRRFLDDDMRSFLAKTGLANNPQVVKMFAKIGQAMQEDKIVTEDKGQGQEKSAGKTLFPDWN